MGMGVGVAAALVGVALAPACQAPTSIILVVSSPVCRELPTGVALAVAGEPTKAEANASAHFVSATSKACAPDGAIGTLVVTPGDSRAGAVVVTAGYGTTVTANCTAENRYAGCIVARRAFTFSDHATLRVPIELEPDCVGIPCDVFTTCRQGTCVSSKVDCSVDGCSEPRVPPGADASTDGSAPVDGGPTNPSDAACKVTAGGPMALQDFRVSDHGYYCIDKTEVTQAAYAAFLASGPRQKSTSPACTKPQFEPSTAVNVFCDKVPFTPLQTPTLPVVCIDRCDAQAYCNAVGKRLCSGSEWADACQADDPGNTYTYGATYVPGACNDNATVAKGKPEPVATRTACVSRGKTPLFDMTGNVWEFTADSSIGGGFLTGGGSAQLGCRFAAGGPPEQLTYELGFRCCKTVP